jgi:hypothetical protein
MASFGLLAGAIMLAPTLWAALTASALAQAQPSRPPPPSTAVQQQLMKQPATQQQFAKPPTAAKAAVPAPADSAQIEAQKMRITADRQRKAADVAAQGTQDGKNTKNSDDQKKTNRDTVQKVLDQQSQIESQTKR